MKYTKPRLGERRIIHKFLFFPKTLARNENYPGVKETRWLERSSIVQERQTHEHLPLLEVWKDIVWYEEKGL